MGYKLLGWVVWNGARWYLRRKLGAKALPAAGVVAGVVGAAAVVRALRRG